MITKLWFTKNRLYWFLLPLSCLYGLISTIRRIGYERGYCSHWGSPVPVIVVGNLTVGGNGKTPFVIWLTQQLQKQGFDVGIVARGYGGSATNYPLLLTDATSAQEAGDEPVLIRQRTHATVVVSPNRAEAVQTLLKNDDVDVVISDDGLQHYALSRDMEIVVIDGERRFGNGWWLPAGPMRERANRLNSVDMVIVNGGTASKNELQMTLMPGLAINLVSGERKQLAELRYVVAIAGIGFPSRFFNMLTMMQLDLLRTVAFPDHHRYTREQLIQLVQPSETLLMTEKDAIKCLHFAQENWWYLPVDANFDAKSMNDIMQKVTKLIKRR